MPTIDGRVIDRDDAQVALDILEGGASNAIALTYQIERMMGHIITPPYGEGIAVAYFIQGIIDAAKAADFAARNRLVGALVVLANSEFACGGLDYPPIYLVLDQVRNICDIDCYENPIYYPRWTQMYYDCQAAVGEVDDER